MVANLERKRSTLKSSKVTSTRAFLTYKAYGYHWQDLMTAYLVVLTLIYNIPDLPTFSRASSAKAKS